MEPGIAVLSALLSLAPAAPAPPLQPVKTVRVGDVELAYVEKGRGQPVVLLHGFGHDYRAWSAELDGLSKNYRVIAYSRRHNAPNPPRSGGADYSDAVSVADLAGFIRTLGLRPAHLIGHSAGAALALFVARDHPELVRTVILAEPVIPSLLAGNPEAAALFAKLPFAEAGKLYQAGDLEGAARVLADAIIGASGAYERMPPAVREMFLENLDREMKAQASAPPDSKRALSCEQARSIRAPALFIEGENTLRLFRLAVEAARACMPGSELAILPRATHALELENPAGFDAIVLPFLARHERVVSGLGAGPWDGPP
jgi:pimeloyl-ACP methyl ester carboxylesterase